MSKSRDLGNLAQTVAVNLPTALGSAGQTLAVNSGGNGLEFADAGGSGTTIHDTLSAMISAATPDEGTLHYNKENDTLYVKAPNGFYAIATISNNSPTFDSNGVSQTTGSSTTTIAADGTFTLTAGTNTVVTINASDADVGQTLTFSATLVSGTQSDVLQSFTQGTGSNTNVFTLVPATSGGGTVEYRFTVSDGTNSAVRDASFTIAFSITDSNFTRLLMSTDDAVGNNQSITDSSSTAHTITVNNDSHAGSFSPYKVGGYSTHFNGSTDYLTIADNSEHEFDGDFSIEFFWKPESVTGNTSGLHIALSCSNDSSTQFIYDESNYWYLQKGSAGAKALDSSGQGSAASAGQWSHVVLCRSGTTLSIFHNGTRTATNSSYTATVDFSGSTIGRYFGSSANYYIDGLLRDMRWLKGSSAYDATQSSITVPTEPLTAVTNTKLLLFHLPYIADGSSTGHTITLSGSTHTQPFSPYDYNEYTEAANGGSISFDGVSDSLQFTASADLQALGRTGTAATIEAWVYLNSAPSTYGTAVYSLGTAGSTGGNNVLSFEIQNNRTLRGAVNGAYSSLTGMAISTGTVPLKIWTHIALVLNSGTWTMYINGTADGSVSGYYPSGTNHSTAYVGRCFYDNGRDADMFVSDLRVTSDAQYTSNFTPPTAPLSTTSNTKLHVKGTDAHVLDKSQSFNFELKGGAAASTTQAKFSNTASVYFDGNGDYIPVISNFFYDKNTSNASTTKFTIETWVYHTARLSSSGYSHIFQTIVGLGEVHMAFGIDHDGYLKFYHQTSSNHLVTSSSTISLNTWTHIAVIVDGSQGSSGVTLKINGTTDGTGSWNGINSTLSYHQQGLSDPHFTIGRYPNGFSNFQQFEGYLQDLRISDTARTITAAPSSPLKG